MPTTSRAQDEVHLPPRDAFADADGYYATLLHELAHSTGHPRRLAREGYQAAAPFGSELYSQEELVAEFAAAFLGSEAGIDPSRVEQSAAYIGSWLEALERDRRLAVVAAAQAQRRPITSSGTARRPGITARGGVIRGEHRERGSPRPPRSLNASRDNRQRRGNLMPTRIIQWEITDAFAKFGFEDGDGHNFTDDVAAAIDAAGPYRCPRQIWGLHNYQIEAIEEETRTGRVGAHRRVRRLHATALAGPAGASPRRTRRPQRRPADRVGALSPSALLAGAGRLGAR